MVGRVARAGWVAARSWPNAGSGVLPRMQRAAVPHAAARGHTHTPHSRSYTKLSSPVTGPSSAKPRRKVTLHKLARLYSQDKPIVMLTAYDAFSARVADAAGADIMLVGDSLGMVVCGRDSTVSVTLEEVVYHCQAVKAGATTPFIVADLPFGTYLTPDDAARNAALLLKSGGAESIKMEGGRRVIPQVTATVNAGIPTMGHVGLTPQTVSALSGFCYQGKTAETATQLLDDALALQEAGCFAIVLECVPGDVAAAITAALDIPTIGIGAGAQTSGQVQVFHDILGMFPKPPKFSRQFAPLGAMAENATTAYVDSVRNRSFPAAKHTFDMNEEEKNLFFDLVDNRFGLASPALLRAQHPRTSDSSENLFDLDLTPPRKIDTVTVVGAGSLGMLIAARLASAGLSRVHLVDLPSNTTLDVINRRGSIRVTEPLTGTEQTATHFPSGRVQAFGSADEALTAGGLADLVVVAVKSCDTAEGAKIAAQLCHGEGTVLSVQNGDNLKTLSDAVGPARLVVGSTTLAANKVGLAAGTVANANPRGHTTLAAVHGNGQARAEALATLINATNCGLGSCTVEGSGPESAANVLWQKLAINAVINPLTALLEVENGRLVGLPAARPLMHSLATEFMAVANAKGLALSWNPDSLLLAAEDVAKATSENKSSMLVDVLRGSPSEIAAITGKVVDEAARLGVLAPTHGALLALVRAKEELRRQARPVAGELEILTTVEDVRQFRQRHAHCTIGMIPTMGGLHAGHMSLVDAALQDCDLAIASIFVNPKQFAPTEDLDVYPRQTQVDLETLRSAGVAAVFLPTAETMYPGTFATAVDIDGIDTVSEGAARPGFFRGVATVCTKLFNIVQPDKVFFGQKDGLQCVVIRRIVQDLNIPTEVVVCPTSREQSGLALSTRNQYLTEKQHKAAPVLYKALLAGSDSFMRGNANDSDTVIAAARAVLEDEPMVETIEYLSLADTRGQEVSIATAGCMLSGAITLVTDGGTKSIRILDNAMLPERERDLAQRER